MKIQLYFLQNTWYVWPVDQVYIMENQSYTKFVQVLWIYLVENFSVSLPSLT